MVDQNVDALNRKIDTIAEKLDTLSASVDTRFHEVSEQFVEQRQYTEFAFNTVRAELRAGVAEMRAEVRAGFAEMRAEMRAGFDQINERLAIFIETQGALNQSYERRIGDQHMRRRPKP